MFYFIVYSVEEVQNSAVNTECKVIDEHPIKWYNNSTKVTGRYFQRNLVLLNWKQISEDEFNMWGE